LEEHLGILKAREQPPGYRVNLCFGDAADPEATEYVTQHFQTCISDPESKTNWREGIDLVKTFLKLRQVGEIDEYGTPLELPKLFVHFRCKDLIREFNSYKAREGTAGRNPREIAEGADDHCLDALRYGLMHLFRLGVNRHLDEIYVPGMVGNGFNQDTPEGLYVPTGEGVFGKLEDVVF
jgi:hypothetical protein